MPTMQDVEKAGLLGLTLDEAVNAFGVKPRDWHSKAGKAAYRKGQAIGKSQLRTAAFEKAIEGDVKCIELAMRFYPEPAEQTPADLIAELQILQRKLLEGEDSGGEGEFEEVLE